MNLELTGVRAIVSGADSGMSVAIAQALAAEGAIVGDGIESNADTCSVAVAVLPTLPMLSFSTLEDPQPLLDGWCQVEKVVTFFRAVLPGMEAARHGRLILVGPIEAKTMSHREVALERTVGLGLLGMLKALSGEVGPSAITCNAVLIDLDPADPAHREAVVASAAATVCYLASPHAAFLTGLVVGVDAARSGSIF